MSKFRTAAAIAALLITPATANAKTNTCLELVNHVAFLTKVAAQQADTSARMAQLAISSHLTSSNADLEDTAARAAHGLADLANEALIRCSVEAAINAAK